MDWESPDGVTKNKIDYMLVNERWHISVSTCRPFPKPDIGSDHQLMMANIKMRLMKTNKGQFTMRYDIEKLNDNLVKIEYDSLICAKVKDIKHDKESSSEKLWCKITNMYNTVAKEVLGYKQRHQTGPWISKEI